MDATKQNNSLEAKASRPVLLVVDDDIGDLEVLGKLLQQDYEVLAAPSGERALQIANGTPKLSLILLDVLMPEMDGYAVLAQLRSNPFTREIPVVFVTGLDSVEDEERGLELGARDYITKPYRPPIILARVRTQLELKRARDWLADQNAFLEEEVARRMKEIEQAQFQLLQAEKLASMGQLAAGIAHEINTPVQYVNNSLLFLQEAVDHLLALCGEQRNLLESARTGVVPAERWEGMQAVFDEHELSLFEEDAPDAIAQAREGVERIQEIVRAVKQFAHPGFRTMTSSDVNEAMRSAVMVTRNEWKYVAELQTDLAPELPMVECMVGEINQVVLNLIVNAAHAIAEAKEKDPQRKGRIILSTRQDGSWAEIRVTDNAMGIPPEVQEKVFNPFFTTKPVGKGTGQGLAIAQRIVVERHKGQLFFETKEGEGTSFIIRLPFAHEACES